mgnify:CR=1 FL=1
MYPLNHPPQAGHWEFEWVLDFAGEFVELLRSMLVWDRHQSKCPFPPLEKEITVLYPAMINHEV